MPHEAEVVAVASPTPGNAAHFAKRFNIPRVFTDYREMLKEPDIEMVSICAPNSLHCQMTKDIAAAGKHIVCEKPLAMTIAEGEEMIAAAKKARRPPDVRRRTPLHAEISQSQRNGRRRRLRQNLSGQAKRKTFRPAQRLVLGRQSLRRRRASWTWAATASPSATGSSAAPPIKSVYCQMGTYVHGDKTKAEDDALCILEFDNGATALIENSWARRGGMDDSIEVFGEAGVSYANLHMGNAMPTYSENGYGYAVEKAPTTKGWTYPVFEELWNYGTPQELTPLRPLRPRQRNAAIHRRRRPRRDESSVRRLRVRRRRPQNRAAHTRRPPAPSGPSTSG